MNIRPYLHKNYEPYDGELGMIDYTIIDLGRKLRVIREENAVIELLITEWEEDQIFIYSFYKDGFSVRRWVEKEKKKKNNE